MGGIEAILTFERGANRISTDSIHIIEVKSSSDGRSTTVVLRDSASTTEIWQSSLTENDLDAFVVVMQPAISIATNV